MQSYIIDIFCKVKKSRVKIVLYNGGMEFVVIFKVIIASKLVLFLVGVSIITIRAIMVRIFNYQMTIFINNAEIV